MHMWWVQLRLVEIGNVMMAGESGWDPFLKGSLIICSSYVVRKANKEFHDVEEDGDLLDLRKYVGDVRTSLCADVDHLHAQNAR